jgi:hypothetical protein
VARSNSLLRSVDLTLESWKSLHWVPYTADDWLECSCLCSVCHSHRFRILDERDDPTLDVSFDFMVAISADHAIRQTIPTVAFRESTPSSVLGQTIEDAFWMCNRNASIEVLSTAMIQPWM